MKHLRFIGIIIIVALSFNSFCQHSIIGKWQGTEKSVYGFVILDTLGYATLGMGGDTMGGKEFLADSIPARMIYKVDYSSNPKTIDFIVEEIDDNSELGRLMGIFDLINDHQIKIRLNFDSDVRPVNFEPEGNADTAIFNRVLQ